MAKRMRKKELWDEFMFQAQRADSTLGQADGLAEALDAIVNNAVPYGLPKALKRGGMALQQYVEFRSRLTTLTSPEETP